MLLSWKIATRKNQNCSKNNYDFIRYLKLKYLLQYDFSLKIIIYSSVIFLEFTDSRNGARFMSNAIKMTYCLAIRATKYLSHCARLGDFSRVNETVS